MCRSKDKRQDRRQHDRRRTTTMDLETNSRKARKPRRRKDWVRSSLVRPGYVGQGTSAGRASLGPASDKRRWFGSGLRVAEAISDVRGVGAGRAPPITVPQPTEPTKPQAPSCPNAPKEDASKPAKTTPSPPNSPSTPINASHVNRHQRPPSLSPSFWHATQQPPIDDDKATATGQDAPRRTTAA